MSSFPSRSFRFQPRLIALALATLAGSACGTLANGRAWGEDATLAPGWERLRWAAHRNAVDPWTWLPIAGAAVLQLDDMDQRISRWARDETPVFGSQEDAEDASSNWRSAAGDLWLASLLAPPGGDAAGAWVWSRTKGVFVQVVAMEAAGGLTSTLKSSVGRERPDESDERSFPSGHTTSAFGSAVLGARNLEVSAFPAAVRWPWAGALYGSAVATAWARVEAGAHYPADVLFAAGATNFVVGFVQDAFLGLEQPRLVVSRGPEDEGWGLGLAWGF